MNTCPPKANIFETADSQSEQQGKFQVILLNSGTYSAR